MKEAFTPTIEKKDSIISAEEFKSQFLNRQIPEEYTKIIEGAALIDIRTPYAENLKRRLWQQNENGRNELTELGKLLAKHIKNGVVVDLGCGDAHLNHDFADFAGEKMFIGIDLAPTVFLNRPSCAREQGEKPNFGTLEPPSTVKLNREDEDEDDFGSPEPEEYSIDDVSKESSDMSDFDKIVFPTTINYRGEILPIPSQIEGNIGEANPIAKAKNEDEEPNCRENTVLLSGDMLKVISQFPDQSIEVIISSGIETHNIASTNKDYLNALAKEILRVLKDKGIYLRYHSDVSVDLEKIYSIDDDEYHHGVYQKVAKKEF